MTGCGGAGGGDGGAGDRCRGPVQLRGVGDLARIAGCAQLTGDLLIRGAALGDPAPLIELRAVTGAVRIGPTLALDPIALLSSLEEVGGDLTADGNLAAGGLYLSALRRVGGDLIITGNTALSGAVLPALTAVGGDMVIAGNPTLARVDVHALAAVAGTLRVADNSALEDLAAPRLARVGALELNGNPALPAEQVRTLDTRLDPGRPTGVDIEHSRDSD